MLSSISDLSTKMSLKDLSELRKFFLYQFNFRLEAPPVLCLIAKKSLMIPLNLATFVIMSSAILSISL